MKLGFILNSRQIYSYFIYITFSSYTFQSLRLVPERPFADIENGKIIGLNCNCLGMIIGNHRSALFIGSCSVDVFIERRIGTVKHKTILHLFNTY